MDAFFYRNWWLYYVLLFLSLGLLVYALLWHPNFSRYDGKILELSNQLKECIDNRATRNIDDKPASNLLPDNRVDCDAAVKSGGQGITHTQHELGNSSGIVVVNYEMEKIPDEIQIYYDDVIVAKTDGLVSGKGSLQFEYTATKGKPSFCRVKVSAPENNTEWTYLVNCPQKLSTK